MDPEEPRSIVPVVDLSPFVESGDDAHARDESLAQLEAACRSSGVFYLRGHGAPAELVERTLALYAELFALPLEARMRSASRPGETSGYEPLDRRGSEFNDSFSYVGGLELMGGGGDAPFLGADRWPAHPPGLEAATKAYMREMHRIGSALVSALALTLGLRADHFASSLTPAHAGSLRARRYPPQRLSSGAVGSDAHVDGLPFALIVQNEVPGLESFVPGHGWQSLPHVPGTIVCQLGSVFARWTDDRYVPNLHRIVNHDEERERRSLVYWYPIHPDATIECVPTCRVPGVEPRYPSIRYADYLVEWVRNLP